MLSLVSDALEAYAGEHTTPGTAVHGRLREATLSQTDLPQMQVGSIEGRLLTILTRLCQAKLAVEVGTFTGYSALHIAEGLAPGGRLITCDIDPHATAIAREHWDQSPWGDRIELRLGPAIETLEAIDEPVDLAFIDADKSGYIAYWDALVPRLRVGGLIVVDNVLWSGSVLNPVEDSAKAIAAFNRHSAADVRMEQVMLTVRDGITVAQKLA